MTNSPAFAWMNGSLVPWENCVLHVRTQSAFWGANIFEGVRAYWSQTARQMYIFRLDAHLRRLAESAKCVRMRLPFDDWAVRRACISLLEENKFQEDVHVVVLAHYGFADHFDTMTITEDVRMSITAIPMKRSEHFDKGASACVASWRRISDDTMPPRIKTGANYHNSRLAQQEAVRNGYDTAFFLNHKGTLAEAPGSCIVMLRHGALHSPPGTAGVLEGVTLDTVSALAQSHLGMPTYRREIDRTELYLADEVFLCGTRSEIEPVTSVDRIVVGSGDVGPVTRRLQQIYDRCVRNVEESHWCLPVFARPALAHDDLKTHRVDA
jgi:branched-chain amino acid aminotransferase